jgi:hypothetical protein
VVCSYIHSLPCIVVWDIGGQIREIVGSTRQGVGRYRVGMKLYFRFSRVFFDRKCKNLVTRTNFITYEVTNFTNISYGNVYNVISLPISCTFLQTYGFFVKSIKNYIPAAMLDTVFRPAL